MSQAIMTRGAAPAPPPAGKVSLYAKTDGRFYWMDEAGVETPFKTVGAGTGDLMSDGSVPLISDWDLGPFSLTALRFHSDEATLSPFTVVSNALVANLNADLLDGEEGSYYASVAYVDAAVVGGVTYRGGYDAATNTPDLDVTPTGVIQGDMYAVTVAGDFYTAPVQIGDVLIAEADDAATEAEWTIVQGNIIVDWKSGTEEGFYSKGIKDLGTNGDKLIVGNAESVFDSHLKADKYISVDTLLLVRDVDDSLGVFCGGTQQALGAYITLFGKDNGSFPSDIKMGAEGVDDLHFDHSAGTWEFTGSIHIAEQAAANVDLTDSGQFWVKTGAPNLPMYTDDAGTDFQLNTDSRSALVKVETGTTYTIVAADNGYTILFTNAAPIDVTLPDTLDTNFHCTIVWTTAAGIPTVTPNTDTINGLTSPVSPAAQWKAMYLQQFLATEWLALL